MVIVFVVSSLALFSLTFRMERERKSNALNRSSSRSSKSEKKELKPTKKSSSKYVFFFFFFRFKKLSHCLGNTLISRETVSPLCSLSPTVVKVNDPNPGIIRFLNFPGADC
jgi:hypothetical protein